MKIPIVLFLLLTVLCPACREQPVSHTEVFLEGSQVSIDVRSLKEGVPVFFAAAPERKEVLFFLVKVKGEVQSYFDACLSCYERKLGFRGEDGHMICKACNVRYPVDELKTGIGGCFPIHLKGRLVGNEYVITAEDLAKGERFF